MSTSCLNTEDYTYLINNKDIITTCQEALRENDLSVSKVELSTSATNQSRTSGQIRTDSDCHQPQSPGSRSSLKDDEESAGTKGRRSGSRCTNDQQQQAAAKAADAGHSRNTMSPLPGTPGGKNQCTSAPSVADFADWLTGIEKQLDSVCLCNNKPASSSSTTSTSSTEQTPAAGPEEGPASLTDVEIVKNQRAIQVEIERVGRRFISAIACQLRSRSRSLTSDPRISDLKQQESRWHSLWIRSLEFLMITEECNKCPNHLVSACTPATVTMTGVGTGTDSPRSGRIYRKNRGVVGGGGGKKVDMMQQKDIGYSSDAELSDSAVEASASPAPTDAATVLLSPASALPSLGSTSLPMSGLSPSRSSSQPRKKVVKRRQRSKDVKLSPGNSTASLAGGSSGGNKRRPWSFHAASEWTDWDYYQPPSFSLIPADPASGSDDTYDSNDPAVRSLIEFGENYEHWFRTDDGCVALRASTPIQDHEDRLRPVTIVRRCDCKSNGGNGAASETDTGKSSGCCLSGEESNYSGAEELEDDRESSLPFITSPAVLHHYRMQHQCQQTSPSFLTSDAGTETCDQSILLSTASSSMRADACTEVEIATRNSSTQSCESQVPSKSCEKQPLLAKPVAKRRSSLFSFSYMVLVTLSVVSFVVHVFLGDRAPHLQLSFTSQPPV